MLAFAGRDQGRTGRRVETGGLGALNVLERADVDCMKWQADIQKELGVRWNEGRIHGTLWSTGNTSGARRRVLARERQTCHNNASTKKATGLPHIALACVRSTYGLGNAARTYLYKL